MPSLNENDFVRLVSLHLPETITALAFSPDGSLIAVAAGDKVHVYQVPAQVQKQPVATTANNPT